MAPVPGERTSTDRTHKTDAAADRPANRRRRRGLPAVVITCAVLAVVSFLALGTWQVRRLQWKLDLIERVENRIHADPVPAPPRDRWPLVNAADDEYRHVRISGTFSYRDTVRVQATTVLGGGFWLLTPLRESGGDVVLVNRGFVPANARRNTENDSHDEGPVVTTVTGLLRMSEPGGGFLRKNNPAANRWYSRDVQAIAAARGIAPVAPYFVDADADHDTQHDAETPTGRTRSANARTDRPIGGLTVVAFQNNHLVYAITWYALALMLTALCVRALRAHSRGDDSDE